MSIYTCRGKSYPYTDRDACLGNDISCDRIYTKQLVWSREGVGEIISLLLIYNLDIMGAVDLKRKKNETKIKQWTLFFSNQASVAPKNEYNQQSQATIFFFIKQKEKSCTDTEVAK